MLGYGYVAVPTGGNPDFYTNIGSYSAVLRVAFGYYDYDEWMENYTGLGTFGILSDFWYV